MDISAQPEQVFPRILLPYTLGIVVFYHFKYPGFLPLLIGINLSLLSLLLLLNNYYNIIKVYRFKSGTGLLFQLFFFFFGGLLCYHHQNNLKSDDFSKSSNLYLKIQVMDEPYQKTGILRFKGQIQSVYFTEQLGNQGKPMLQAKTASGKIMVAIKLDHRQPLAINYGEELLIPASYTPIKSSFHPAQFDYQAWLAAQNIRHQSFLLQNQVIKLGLQSGNELFKFAIALRVKQVKRYQSLLQDNEAVAMASTLILGYRADLSKEILAIYSKTGTIHALSVSGMHVGLIYLILNYALAFLNQKRNAQYIKLFLILGLLWFYALLTGCSPSVLRSVIMISIFLVGKTYSRPANKYNILSFAAFAMLLYDPFLIWDVGFQLSFLAVFGLLYLQPKLQDCWTIQNKWARKLWGIISMSLAAQLFTFPLSIYYFHQFPFLFLLGNLFILIPVTLIMYLGILLLIPGLDFLAPVLSWLIQFNNTGLKFIAAIPYSVLSGIWINKVELLLLSVFLTLGTMAIVNGSWRLLMAAFSFFLVLQFSLSRTAVMRYHQQEIIRFEIPKQQAIAYIFAQQATVYTHLKQEDDAFQYFIQPVLAYHQIRFLKIIPLPP
ncbi:ComEC/Rec2 family competence protein [Pedobacter gandavensis]|uniref:ComEC/Rec2 family competence protein n=1 Tax=Pedobacter gandavensis TaxID=2679963 RepID=UPI00247B0DF5|nr:ComEC/Rec2 family competence protein [Pedobacter gandavensis]WGQ11433.1 ComEC/Rec2 family competence protein [Pedobacter gandavensis]